MKIHGLNKLTLLDYPGHTACTVFCGHCNLRCPFCHNAELVLNPDSQPLIAEDEVIAHLKKRAGVLEGVAITGGEPTLYKDLPDFIRRIKAETGVRVKLDTNGTNPEMVKALIEENLVDYIAMDVKDSLPRYAVTVGVKNFDTASVEASVKLIMGSGIDYEFRTTAVGGIHDNESFKGIGEWIKGAKAYFIQQYKDSGDLIAPEGLYSPSAEDMAGFRETVLPYVPVAQARGV